MSLPESRGGPADRPPGDRFAPREAGWEAFWAAAAEALVPWLAAPGGPAAIVVPRGALVAPLQRALRGRLAPPGRPWAPPPIRPLAQWADEGVPAVPVDGLARTLGLLQVLDEAMPDSLPGRSPADRLAFAAGLLDVLDAFVQAGAAGRLADPDWIAGVVEAFGAVAAAERLRDDLALVARIAVLLAPSDGDPVAQAVARMKGVAQAWARRGTRVAWIAWQAPESLEAVLLAELDARLPAGAVLRLWPDWTAIGEAAPLLRAAWPECFEAPEATLRDRRLAWRRAPSGPRPEILHASDRELEAQLAAQWVHRRLAERIEAGAEPPRIAIVALDRWLARRVRALLERACVLIDDREGWLLSTTVAASAAMGWLDAVAGDGYYDDLIGWLDSRFVRPPGHRPLRDWIERRATHHRYLRGWDGLRATSGADAGAMPAGVGHLIDAARLQRHTQPLRAHLERLDETLRWAGAPGRLAADAAGRQLLGLLDALRRTSAAPGHARPLPFAEFRALLAMLLERHRFFGSIDSPVELLTPIDAAGRDFDAVLVLGAADGALPAPPPPLPLVNEPLRAMLGLPTAASLAAAQQRDLSLLLVLAARSALTCRTAPDDGTRPSPWVERLEAVVGDAPLHERIDRPGTVRRIVPVPSSRPSVVLAEMPASVSVGGIERLVACPFRFLSQDGWRLREPREAVDVPGVRERGELVHEILDRFHSEVHAVGLVPDPATRDTLHAMLVEATEGVATRELAAGGGTLGEIAEWRATLEGYLDWTIEDAAGGWRWIAGEAEGSATVDWAAPDGPRSLRIDGRLDRLDRGPGGLRIVDYKLGAPDRLKRLAGQPDRAAQLVLYAWMASGQGAIASTGYLSLRRDGVTWVPLRADAAATLTEWRERLPGYLARIDAGEPLTASGTECEHCASRGLCRRGHWS